MKFDYTATAELFPAKSAKSRTQVGYMRFGQAAEAIQFAIEVLPGNLLLGTFLEVGDTRFGGDAIRRLYHHPTYPLTRRV
jgi:hypothetical protein